MSNSMVNLSNVGKVMKPEAVYPAKPCGNTTIYASPCCR
jgi:hypothetical protein